MTSEDIMAWQNIDEDVRKEISMTLELCRDSSPMDDIDHPKHAQFNDGIKIATRILES